MGFRPLPESANKFFFTIEQDTMLLMLIFTEKIIQQKFFDCEQLASVMFGNFFVWKISL